MQEDIRNLHQLQLCIEQVGKIKKLSKEHCKQLRKKLKEEKITRTAIVIISDVIDPENYEYSKLYDKEFSHGYRKAKSK